MTEIAPVSNYGCLQRGVSIMRLALGYEKGLPHDWKITGGGPGYLYTIEDEVRALVEAFPKHTVRIICSKKEAEIWGLEKGEWTYGYAANVDKFGDSHIFAISYVHNCYGSSHFLVGNLVLDMVPFIRYVVTVSIKEKNARKM